MMSVKKNMHSPLTPIEKIARDYVVWKLHSSGYNVTSISKIVRMSQSGVSRLIKNKPSDIDGVFNVKPFDGV